jgi:hypothetical protein
MNNTKSGMYKLRINVFFKRPDILMDSGFHKEGNV